ncbi:MAG: hypothetical protein HYX69_18680 [Planctomycetia bacterium]|nr:hypothetical protein [Planctomycetia bacterium]
MSVAFEELEGSPRIRVNEQGTTAVRVFRVAWTDWQDLAHELIGTFRVVGLATQFVPPITFPGLPNLIVSDLTVEPFDPGNPDGSAGVTLGARTNAYPAGGAKLTATYRTMLDERTPSRKDLPKVPDGTFLTYSADLGSERLAVPGRAWRWSAMSSERVPDDVNPGVLVPSGVFTLRWQRVPAPPWTKIRELRGKVNNAAFVSATAETVLFLGARVSRRFQFVDDGGFWNLDYTFAENTKTLADGLTKVGWNYFFRETAIAGQHWLAIQDADGNPPYAAGDFLQLFQFE